MAIAFVGEIRPFPYNFAPQGWAFCEGQLLSIAQNTALFSLLGTTYGGNGQTTFALPDLRGRVPMGMLDTQHLGEIAGQERVTLLSNHLPAHSHGLAASNAGGLTSPVGAHPGSATGRKNYGAPNGALSSAALTPTGSTGSHDNRQPYLVLSYAISLFGDFPPRD